MNVVGYFKIYTHWVLCSLTHYHKTVWKEVCLDLLSSYKADGESFLSQILSLGMKCGSITSHYRQKTVSGMSPSSFSEKQV